MSIFLERTKQLLRERPKQITLALIVEETGLKQAWLESLLYKDEPNPSIISLEALYNYLSDKPFSFDNLEAKPTDDAEHFTD